MSFVDCLVLKLEEIEYESQLPDTTIYIIFDKLNNKFIIRGKRRDIMGITAPTYSFEYNNFNKQSLVDFIKYVICHTNTVNETMYNFDNMPKLSDEITYDFLQRHENKDYEISGYNNQKLSRKRISRLLDILENVFNLYN